MCPNFAVQTGRFGGFTIQIDPCNHCLGPGNLLLDRKRSVMTLPLDPIDRGLLEVLTEDSRTPMTGLARRLGVARSTVQTRLARLENRGVIVGYTVRLGRAHQQSGVEAHVSLVIDARKLESVVGALERLAEVKCLSTTSGSVDLMAQVRCDDPRALDQLLDHIGRLDGVHRTNSMVVLATRIDRRDLP